jgi:HTH-type transcriptional regulator/antitoxin HipB
VRVRSIHDVAATVRGRRLDLGLTQAEVARRVGVSRKWINEFEAGRPRAELGIVLRAIEELGLGLEIVTGGATESPPAGSIDLDQLLAEHRGR